MANSRSSSNYIWSLSNMLGKGATGAVYAGVHKKTGEAVAVKSFNQFSHLRPYEVQRREFDVLKRVNHDNIVKLLAIEEENDSKHKVLIMELCNAGSLFNILDDPINSFGLEEKEFITVLKHLSAGIKHLRDNDLIHRDLKPGNIMKHIKLDGTSIYKLTDFGAARELKDDQQFISLYGTEEYLHPDMFEKAVLRKPAGKSFRANVDLWSIGVTLYHTATGSLPFRPYGGRKDKETMFKITSEKQSGIISGIQKSENGEIEWSKHLPKTCLLNNELQRLVTPLLAGLMERDTHKMWSFDEFFESVTKIFSHRVIHLFFINHLKDVIVYLHPSENTGNDLRRKLEKVTGVSVKSQLLMWNKQNVITLNEIETTEDNPIYLVNYDTNEIKPCPLILSSPVKAPDFQENLNNFDQDARVAKTNASIAYSIQKLINRCVATFKLVNAFPSQLISITKTKISLLIEKEFPSKYLYKSIQNQLQTIIEYNQTVNQTELMKIITTDDEINKLKCKLDAIIGKYENDFKELKERSTILTKEINEIKGKENVLNDIWFKNIERYKESNKLMTSAMQFHAKQLCAKIRESWQTLHKDKSTRLPSPSEEEMHHIEKIKIQSNVKKLTDLLDTCYFHLSEQKKRLEDWFRESQASTSQIELIFHELILYSTQCESFQRSLNEIKEEQKKLFSLIFVKLSNQIKLTKSSSKSNERNVSLKRLQNGEFNDEEERINNLLPTEYASVILNELKSIREGNREIDLLLKENHTLISEMNSFSSFEQQSN